MTQRARIHLIEANPHLRSLLVWHLGQLGHEVDAFAGVGEAAVRFRQASVDLAIVARELTEGDGLDYCRRLVTLGHPLILLLSTRNTQAEIVEGLRAGADDYLVKPFGLDEFLARVEALLRRLRPPQASAELKFGDLQIDLVQRRVQVGEKLIDLTPQEFSLLYVLVQAQSEPLTRQEILARAWPEEIDNPRTVDTHVLTLRKKLQQNPDAPQLIETVRNVGYRFCGFNVTLSEHPQNQPLGKTMA